MLFSGRAGIIAAGHGLRFKPSYPDSIKPMIPLRGAPLIYWTVSSLRQAGIRRITILFNSQGGPARQYLESHFRDVEWTFLAKDTRSSWESFRIVYRSLAQIADPFLISTVDAIAPPREISRFIQTAFQAFTATTVTPAQAGVQDLAFLDSRSSPACRQAGGNDAAIDMALALTPFVRDDKPLWADLSQEGWVTALGPDAKERKFVTCGLYAMRQTAASLPAADAYDSLREFWISAARQGRRISGTLLPQTIDVDRPEDLAAAEIFLKTAGVSP